MRGRCWVGDVATFPTRWFRGEQIRTQRSHGKAVVLGYWQGGQVWGVCLCCGTWWGWFGVGWG
ncbi:MAG: hypothetical protein KatS3mg016_1287 [Fimbriimonadales bacterium]|nr:MAG: hypothetical protein KatS3mg016_1287 [Fimbriimonadales bacterium]